MKVFLVPAATLLVVGLATTAASAQQPRGGILQCLAHGKSAPACDTLPGVIPPTAQCTPMPNWNGSCEGCKIEECGPVKSFVLSKWDWWKSLWHKPHHHAGHKGGHPGGIGSPAFPTHPFLRSPRDFFMLE